MEKTGIHFLDKAINGLKEVVSEIEGFQLQYTLGKAEAVEKYAEAKRKFLVIINDAKNNLSEGKEKLAELKQKFNEIEKLFEKDKFETKEAINAEKQKFIQAIDEIERDLKQYR